MQSEIITIGDELLMGQKTDTNSAHIAKHLNKLGFRVARVTSIPDNHDSIVQALENIFLGSYLVIVTGGLGPTSDDLTRDALCTYFNTILVRNDQVHENIKLILAKKGLSLNAINEKQALVPKSCEILSNEVGTSPGLVFSKNNTLFIFLPGVPFEMVWIMQNRVIPYIQKKIELPPVLHRMVLTSGATESQLSELLRDFEAQLPHCFILAYLPSPGVLRLRLSCYNPGKESTNLADSLINKLKTYIPDYFVSSDYNSLEEYCKSLLTKYKLSVSTAESCTGGKLASLLTSLPGSSEYFKGSVVAYSNEIKVNVLEIPEKLIAQHGAVSSEVAELMALNIRRLFNTNYGIAISGIAGPTGGTHKKPVGTVWISVSSHENTQTTMFKFGDNREINILRASNAALNVLRKMIENEKEKI